MKEYKAQRLFQFSGRADPIDDGVIEVHSWRRSQDRGKRRLTYGVYGSKAQITKALAKEKTISKNPVWSKFRNGKFMVW